MERVKERHIGRLRRVMRLEVPRKEREESGGDFVVAFAVILTVLVISLSIGFLVYVVVMEKGSDNDAEGGD